MARRSSLRGVSDFRKLLRALPDAVTEEVKEEVREAAELLDFAIKSNAPKGTGDLAASVGHVISSDGLTAVIGPGAKAVKLAQRTNRSVFGTRNLSSRIAGFSAESKRLLFQVRKALWIEFGTKGGSRVRRQRGRMKPKKTVTWPAHPARPFIRPAWDQNVSDLISRHRRVISTVLARLRGRT